MPAWAGKVGAGKLHFLKKQFLVNQYGAKGNGTTGATKAIQAAIDACAKAGGGTVSFEPGTYLMGAIFLKKGVHLNIPKGVLILGSQNFADYPTINTRIAGMEMPWPAALINVIGQKGVAISGEGKVNARGKFCWDKYWAMRKDYEARGLRWIVDYDAQRVRTLLVQESSNIEIKGITFSNAGFWTVQVLYSHHVTVDGVTIRNNEDGHGPSTDGIDIDSSSWVLVENCDIDCNDDDFCLKAGRDWDGLRVNRPTEYVVIRNSIARRGAGLLTMGSETSGSIRHVLAYNLVAKGTSNGLQIKSATTRGGVVEDIHFRNIEMDSVRTAFQFTMNWNPAYSYATVPAGMDTSKVPQHWKTMLQKVTPESKGIPQFRNIYVSGVQATNSTRAINAQGLEASVLEGFYFEKTRVGTKEAGELTHAANWIFNNMTIEAADGKPLRVKASRNITGLTNTETSVSH
ncbi:Glycosyl hydrolases family 28 [Cnuella takakiae]|uniref:Glycosyl hydrolases family 28 n=2 Tax=Cnuella takakiae TaxID=1302690 RepID=A0A1M4USK2_9BACT|nr:Glycosyl hydrolases family 28 [Cnuella takakiae]